MSHRDIRHYDGGGAPLYIHEIFKRLTHRYDITILSTAKGSLLSREVIDGIKIIRVGIPRLARFTIPVSLVAHYARNVDVIVDNGDIGLPWLTPLYSNKPKICIIYQVAADIFRYELHPITAAAAMRTEHLVYRLYQKTQIVACSESTKRDLVSNGLSSENVRVIRPGIGEEFLKFQSREAKFVEPTVVCIGRFKRYKGLHYAIRAMRFVLEAIPDANLKIIGSGDPSELRSELARTRYSRSVSIVTRQPNKWNAEKREILSRSHLLLVPSVREGYGIVVIEANSCGTPAVGWDVSGLRDSIIHGETGLLVPFGDVEALGKTIVECLSDKGAMNHLSKHALTWARKHSWDIAAKDFGAAIDSLFPN